MMEALSLYIVESTVCISLLCIGFIGLLGNTTCFRFNRSVILWGCLLCVLLPFFRLELRSELLPARMPAEVIRSVAAVSDATEAVREEPGDRSSSGSRVLPVAMIAGILYGIGCLTVMLVTVLSHLRIWAILRRSECIRRGSYRLYVSPEQEALFCWGRCIVIPRKLYDSGEHLNEILVHEIAHLRRRHTLDILFMQLFVIVHWFNPFVWLLRRRLLDIHEYQADNDVIDQGINATQYQLLLVEKAVGSRLYILADGLTHSKLKKRITMMLKKRTSRMARLRVLLFVPLAAGAISSFATTAEPASEQGVQDRNASWAYPVPGSELGASYRPGGHSGVDLKAEEGTGIGAAFDGTVVFSEFQTGRGNTIVIRHSDGLQTVYAHNSENLVNRGDEVKAGQQIARVGSTGRSTGPHCHFEIRKHGRPVDPGTIFDIEAQTLRAKLP